MNCIVKKTVLKFCKHLVSRRVVNLVDNRETFRKSRHDLTLFLIFGDIIAIIKTKLKVVFNSLSLCFKE